MRPNTTYRLLLGACALGLGAWWAQAAAPTTPQGVITAKSFFNIGGGTTVADLTGNAKFPNSPDAVTYPTYFELNATGDINTAAPNTVDNYGAQMLGYFYPPATGDYIFYLASDDGGQLWLSTDADPANKKLIAQEAGWSNARSYTAIGGGSTVEAKDSSQFTGTQWPTKDPVYGGAKITLTANRAYYIEALMKEGGGGDNLSVAVQDPNFVIDSTKPIPGQYLSSFDKASGPVVITTQPQSQTVNQGDPVTFTVAVDGTPPYNFQWMVNNSEVQSGAQASYNITRALATQNNAKVKVVVTGGQGSPVTSAEATLTVISDVTPPTLVGARGSASFNAVTVTFSEPLDPATANTAANYRLSGGLNVTAASLSAAPNDNTVVLTTSRQSEGTVLTLTVNNVKDLAGLTIAANSTIDFKTHVFATGWASYQRWHNENGDPGDINAFATAIADGTIRAPDYESAVTQFGGPWGARDNYSARVFGYFIPPANGNYVFFVGSDDQSVVYLSTDDQPANKKLIARETQWSNQYQFTTSGGNSDLTQKRSDQNWEIEWPNFNTITLTANRRYYMEVLWDEGGGGDGADVTFIREGDPDPSNDAAGMRMRGSVIATFLDPNGAAVNILAQPANATQQEGRTATFSVTTSVTSPYATTASYQWQKTTPGGSTFTDIAGATAVSYTTPVLALVDNNTKYRVVCSVPTLSVNSAEATLTVVPDTFPPQLAGAGALASETGATFDVGVSFDEAVTAASAGNPANYTLSGGSISAVTLYPGSPGVVLRASGLTVGNTYTVTVRNLQDLKGNTLTSAEKPFKVSPMKWGVVGGKELGIGNGVLAVAENGFDVYSDSIAEWGTYDEATFVYEEVTGDFDKIVQVEYQDASSQWARAGLIVRDVTNFGVDRATQEAGQAGRYQKVHVNPVVTAMGTGGNNAWEGNRRLATGAATTSAGGGGGPLTYPNTWCRLQRAGDLFTIYRSTDGRNWTQLGTTTFDEPMPARLFVGPEFAPENGNIPEDSGLRGMWLAKFRNYGNYSPFVEPTLSYSNAGGVTVLTYSGVLQSAPAVTGPYTPVAGATSPYTVNKTQPAQFYRAAGQ